MASRERSISSQVMGGVGEIFGYPFSHPRETAKTLAIAGLAIAGSLITTQVSMLWAEHGGSRGRRQEETSGVDQQEEMEQIDEC